MEEAAVPDGQPGVLPDAEGGEGVGEVGQEGAAAGRGGQQVQVLGAGVEDRERVLHVGQELRYRGRVNGAEVLQALAVARVEHKDGKLEQKKNNTVQKVLYFIS